MGGVAHGVVLAGVTAPPYGMLPAFPGSPVQCCARSYPGTVRCCSSWELLAVHLSHVLVCAPPKMRTIIIYSLVTSKVSMWVYMNLIVPLKQSKQSTGVLKDVTAILSALYILL